MKKVDNAGRVIIPKEFRKELNLDVGAGYEVIKDDDVIKVIPKEAAFKVYNEDMKVLRKMYLMLEESGMLDSYYDEILSRITKRTDVKCETCGANLFLNKDNTYKCFKCE